MGFFDVFNSTEATSYKARSEREAWMAFTVASLLADGEITDIETTKMTSLLGMSNVFGQGDYISLYIETMQAHEKHGAKALMEGAMGHIHSDSKDTLFAHCADLMLADGNVTHDERHILGFVAERLGVGDDLATKIIEVLLIKNKRNITHTVIE